MNTIMDHSMPGTCKKTILVAYDLNPKLGTECGLADLWLKTISKHFMVDVFVDQHHQEDILSRRYENAKFYFIPMEGFVVKLLRKFRLYNLLNFIFVRKVEKKISALDLKNYALIHSITPLGFHSWNRFYKFNIPQVVGPVIGGLNIQKTGRRYSRSFLAKDFIRRNLFAAIRMLPSWKRYFRKVSHIIVGAEHIYDFLPRNSAKSSLIFNCSVDADKFVPISPQKNTNGTGQQPHEPVKVLFVGKLLWKKGVHVFVDACRHLRQTKELAFNAVIWGQGPLEHQIRQDIKRHGLDDCLSLKTDRVSDKDLKHLYQAHDIFCFPSLNESGGMVILEAMACGLPVITTDYGGPSHTVTQTCGIKIKPEEYESFVEKIADAMAALIQDKKRRKVLGRNARFRVERHFSSRALEEKILSVYGEVIHQTKYNNLS